MEETTKRDSGVVFCPTLGERCFAIGLFTFIIVYAVWPMLKAAFGI